MTNLAFSIVSVAFLTVCSDQANPHTKDIIGAVQWASTCTLLSSAVYVLWGIYKFYQPRNLRGDVRYDGPVEAPNGFEELEQSVEVQATVVLYPELTITSVWVYVYGWGLLLFVSLYCLSGIQAVSTCWWILGMTTLVADELINSSIGVFWTAVLITGLSLGSTMLWFLEYGNNDIMADQLENFLLGVFSPTVCPFIFFSLRNTVQSNMRDVSRLFGLAMPFMVVLALCALAGTLHETDGQSPRRGLMDAVGFRGTSSLDMLAQLRLLKKIKHNATSQADMHLYHPHSPLKTLVKIHLQTPVQTNQTPVQSQLQTPIPTTVHPQQTSMPIQTNPQTPNQTTIQTSQQTPVQLIQVIQVIQTSNQTQHPNTQTTTPIQSLASPTASMQTTALIRIACLCLSPIATLLVLRQLIYSVMEGFTTEFVNALLLVMTVRHWSSDPSSMWSVFGVALNGICFVLILCVRGS